MNNKSSIKNQKYFVDDWLKVPLLKTGSKKMINLRNVRDVQYATKPLNYLLLVSRLW